ncbi:MAG TPA: hypothetical protein ENI81_00305 [Phycisphaerales bacterium]|nr:hypothetical protein [Phycisphaerales bacterium]
MQSAQKISGYGRVLAKIRVDQQVNKPLLGKPYLKYGQCYALWSYFLQLGGILAAKHSAKLDAFGHAFLGMWGPSGSVANFFAEVAECIVSDYVRDSVTFGDFVTAEFIRRIDYRGDAQRFFYEQGMNKLPTDTAQELAWQYSQQGAALGIIYPHIVRRMFEQTHAAVPKKFWRQAHAAGLNIPREQDLMSYEETEEGENEGFMLYCRECCPDLNSILCM